MVRGVIAYLDGFAYVGERAAHHVSESVEPHHLLHQYCVHALREMSSHDETHHSKGRFTVLTQALMYIAVSSNWEVRLTQYAGIEISLFLHKLRVSQQTSDTDTHNDLHQYCEHSSCFH